MAEHHPGDDYPTPEELTAEREQSYAEFNPASLLDDLEFMRQAVNDDLHFEPYYSEGGAGVDIHGLWDAAMNFRNFVLEYKRRTGSFELPPEP